MAPPTDTSAPPRPTEDDAGLVRLLAPPESPARRRASSRRGTAQHLLEGPGWTPLRIVVDFSMALLALCAALLGANAAGLEIEGAGTVGLLPLLIIATLAVRGMYRRRVRMVILDGIGPVVGAVSVSAMVVITLGVFLSGADGALGALVTRAWAFSVLFVTAGRASLVIAQRRARSRGMVGKPTLIVGAGEVGTQVARRLREHQEYGLIPIAFLDEDPPASGERQALQIPVVGSPDELPRVASLLQAEHVILAFSPSSDRSLIPVVRECEALGLEVSLVPRLFESITDRVELERLGGLPLVGLRAVDPRGWQFRLKYAADRALAAVALVVAAPFLLAVAGVVKLSSPGPVLFRQRRVGRDGTSFDLLKFRSMRTSEDRTDFRPRPGSAPGGVEGVDRRTPIGRFLRRSSLDELPQLINVLQGDMSLVGPRPERPEFVELFRHDVARYGDRHRVKSGITGWAQVHGLRGQTSLADRVEWDNFYIENWSLWLDVKIVIMTVAAVMRGD